MFLQAHPQHSIHTRLVVNSCWKIIIYILYFLNVLVLDQCSISVCLRFRWRKRCYRFFSHGYFARQIFLSAFWPFLPSYEISYFKPSQHFSELQFMFIHVDSGNNNIVALNSCMPAAVVSCNEHVPEAATTTTTERFVYVCLAPMQVLWWLWLQVHNTTWWVSTLSDHFIHSGNGQRFPFVDGEMTFGFPQSSNY